MMSPGIRQALAREHENEIAGRAARSGPMRTPDAPRAARVRNLVAMASGVRHRERRAAMRATDCGTGRA